MPTPPAELLALLQSYDYPGNVRGLKSVLFDAVSRHGSGILSLVTFQEAIGVGEALSRPAETGSLATRSLLTIGETVDALIQAAMLKASGEQTIAARILGISPQALGHVSGGRRRDSRQDAPSTLPG